MMSKVLSATFLSVIFLFAVCAYAASGETVVYSFNQQNNGAANPTGGLLMDKEGNLYGATQSGAVFEFSPNGSGGWNYTTLCNCPYPAVFGSLVMDQAGNLYGSTFEGNVIEYSLGESGVWNARVIYTFQNGTPSPVILDAAGNLYGVAASGVNGFVFELSPSSSDTWTFSHLHDFSGSDGSASANAAGGMLGGLIMDSAGNLYGTTWTGGVISKCTGGCGVVFELKNESGAWSETVLHRFHGSDGMNPDAALLMDVSGNLYGTTTAGGAHGFGVVFKVTVESGQGQTTSIHSFSSGHGDGAYPNSALTMDASGNLYGATYSGGGSSECNVENDTGCGIVFQLTKTSNAWKESVLHDFSGKQDGAFPGALTLDADGNLYGLAQNGGAYFGGLLFKVSP
jgi:uncharacterized repeat protein (TIGR03803 family)